MSKTLELLTLSNKLNLKESGASKKQKLFAETTIHKILETNSSFYVKQHNA